MRELRITYTSNKDTVTYGATSKKAEVVKARVYSPQRCSPCAEVLFTKLEAGVFALDFEFRENGNYIFVIEEDGNIEMILNAKVRI